MKHPIAKTRRVFEKGSLIEKTAVLYPPFTRNIRTKINYLCESVRFYRAQTQGRPLESLKISQINNFPLDFTLYVDDSVFRLLRILFRLFLSFFVDKTHFYWPSYRDAFSYSCRKYELSFYSHFLSLNCLLIRLSPASSPLFPH